MNIYRKRIKKIQSQIQEISNLGRDNYIQWSIFIDDVISKSEYSLLSDVLETQYNYIVGTKTIDIVKVESWDAVLFLLQSGVNFDRNKILKELGLYQNGINIYMDSDNHLLGEIKEEDVYIESIDSFGYTESDFQKITKNKKTILIVSSNSLLNPVIFEDWDFTKTYQRNMLNLYSESLNFLKNL
jgi:hypothetical protein